jgi:hypothetical protein
MDLSDTSKRAFRTLLQALTSAVILAIGPVVYACKAADVDSCVKSLGTFPEAFMVGAVYGVGTAMMSFLHNAFEDNTDITLLPK